MAKQLEDMTLEELWLLFPVTLAMHNPDWKTWAADEIRCLSEILADYSPIISHIGSTAIPHIKAKPIVDILIEIDTDRDWNAICELLISNDYICMARSERRMSFNKGYTINGYADNVYHVHIHPTGDNCEILFRDYLIANPDAAREYEQLKLSLLPELRNDRDAYTAAKSQFIERILALCKANLNSI